MSVSLILVALGALVAVIGTGVVTTRCTSAPRLYLAIWSLALFALTVGLGSQAAGYLIGYSTVLFRAMELGVQAVAPLALSLAMVEIVGRSVPARFAMRLVVASIAVITVVILATDPLSASATFGKTWPDPAAVFGSVPRFLLEYLLAPFVVVTAVASMLAAGSRRKRSRADRDVVVPAVAGGFAIIALAMPVVLVLVGHDAGASLPISASGLFALSGLLAAALAWFGGARAPMRRPGGYIEADGDAYDGRSDYGEDSDLGPETGQWHDDAGRDGRYPWRADQGHDGVPPREQGYGDADSEYRYPALAALAAESDDPSAPNKPNNWYNERDPYHDGYREGDGQDMPGRYYGRPGPEDGQSYGEQAWYGRPDQARARYDEDYEDYYDDNGYPGNGHPGNGHPGNSYPGNGHPGNGYPGNGYPGNSYPGNGHPGNSYPGNSYPGNSYPGNGYPGNGHPGNGYRGNGYADPYAGENGYSREDGYGIAGPDMAGAPVPYSGGDPTARLFGQIVIYSLVEAYAEVFDRLTERVVAQVRASEPDTLVYIVHHVPTAPLQRILYEVYRDRAAYGDHQRQAYIRQYDDERQPLIAAMNVIELGLQQAKVSPLPSIAEILTESGIDLTNVTGSSRRAIPPDQARAWQRRNELPAPPGWDRRPESASHPYESDWDGMRGSDRDGERREESWYR